VEIVFMDALWQTRPGLADAARWGGGRAAADRSRATDLALLFTLGCLAALATTFAMGGWRIPGHAILRGTLPFILGVSLAPRRTAGSAMSLAAAVTFAALRLAGLGLPHMAAMGGVLCLGPAIDVALTGATSGWRLYARLALAGLVANLAAFAVRMAGPAAALAGSGRRGMGDGTGGGRGLASTAGAPVEDFWLAALASFALCGAIAGLACAALWFRAHPSTDRAHAP
jgi:hypothetical protein